MNDTTQDIFDRNNFENGRNIISACIPFYSTGQVCETGVFRTKKGLGEHILQITVDNRWFNGNK